MRERSEFAALMRGARRHRDMTLASIASQIGTAVSYLSDVESDKRLPPRSPVIIQWARAIGVDPAAAVKASGRPLEITGDETELRALMRQCRL